MNSLNQLSLARSGSGSDKDIHNDGKEQFFPIDAKVYKLLVEGKKDDISKLKIGNFYQLKSKEDENSVLHIAGSTGQAQVIAELLPSSKDIITWTNNIGDLAFHSAAKASQFDAVKALMNWKSYKSKEKNISAKLLGIQNDEGDTPLHIALENCQEKMAQILMDEYGEACYKLNKNNVSPLYMAIQSKCWELVKQMIAYTKENKATSEPELIKGKSIVHVAIDADNTGKLC